MILKQSPKMQRERKKRNKFQIWFKYDFIWWMEREGGCEIVAGVMSLISMILSMIVICR